MLAEIEIIIQPYSSLEGKSTLEILINEFNSAKWVSFQAAIAFLRQSGNNLELIEAMQKFVTDGGSIEMTVGADTFGRNAKGSDYEAIKTLLYQFGGESNVKLYLYHEKGRTFHPKLYMFSNEPENRALLIMGSSNWSHGGLVDNIEANVILKLELENEEHMQCYRTITDYFATYWTETE